jgi:hypothetical protein
MMRGFLQCAFAFAVALACPIRAALPSQGVTVTTNPHH